MENTFVRERKKEGGKGNEREIYGGGGGGGGGGEEGEGECVGLLGCWC